MDEDLIGTEGELEGDGDFTEGDETGEFIEGDETGDLSGDEEPEEPNEWDWAADLDPTKVQKTWERFTQELEGVKAQADELAPYRQLKEMMDENPRLLDALEAALNEEPDDAERVQSVERDVSDLRMQLKLEKDFGELRSYAQENGYPEFDEKDVLRHATSNGIGSLKAAYHDMFVKKIAEAEVEKTVNGIKKSKGAKTGTKPSGSSNAKQTFTKDEIANMSAADFEKNYAAISASFARK